MLSAACQRLPAVLLALFLGTLCTGCAEPDASAPEEGPQADADTTTTGMAPPDTTSFRGRFVAPIEEAHAAETWRAKEALAADVTVRFGGQTRMNGRMVMETDAGRTRFELGGDTVAVFDGTNAWVAPDSAALPRARFNLITWPYFAAAPYKLRDPGTRLARHDSMSMNGTMMPTARLTFAPGTGDSPDDWYTLYRHPRTGRLAAMSYIVTYGNQTAEEATPHAIVYDAYQTVEGVPIPTEWTFYNWSEARGPHGDPIGRVTLRNPHFTRSSPDAFGRPDAAQKSSLPG